MLLVPVSAVMTWAAGSTYSAQLAQLQSEARTLATAVAAHIDQSGGEPGRDVSGFLRSIPLEYGGVITIVDGKGTRIAQQASPGLNVEFHEMAFGSATAARPGWIVNVGLPTSVAWSRAGPVYRRTIA